MEKMRHSIDIYIVVKLVFRLKAVKESNSLTEFLIKLFIMDFYIKMHSN